MATVQVDVELSEIDFYDLLEEVIERIPYRKRFTYRENELMKRLKDELYNGDETPICDNLRDEMKLEFLMEMRDKYSEHQLREMERVFAKQPN